MDEVTENLDPERDGGLFDNPDIMDEMAQKEEMTRMAMAVPLDQKIEKAIAVMKNYEKLAIDKNPNDGYYLCFSGGKDSIVIKKLAEMAGVKHKSWYGFTTIDPPEVLKFIKDKHPDVNWIKPKKPLLSLVKKKGPPTRHGRWCCELYKEVHGEGLVKLIGVRVAESRRRYMMWRILTPWSKDKSYCVCPILYWTDQDVWKFIRDYNIPYCSLYDEGIKRIGCVGCPIGNWKNKLKEFERWPGFEKAWKHAITQYWKTHYGVMNTRGEPYYASRFPTAEAMWEWWMTGDRDDDQSDCMMGLF